MARKCAFLDIDATAFKKLILSNVGSEEGGARQSGFPNAADKEDLYAKINFEAKRHGRKGTRMNSVESPSASLCSDGNSPTLTPPSSSSASNPPPARPPPHSLWSKSVEGSESECLIWSELVGCDLVKSDLVGWSLCDQTIWWPPLAKEASPYPCLKYQPAIPCSEIFSAARPKCFRKYFRPRYLDTVSLSWQLLTLLYTADVLKIWIWQFFLIVVARHRACYGTVLAVPYVQNIFQPKMFASYFSWCWRWHWC